MPSTLWRAFLISNNLFNNPPSPSFLSKSYPRLLSTHITQPQPIPSFPHFHPVFNSPCNNYEIIFSSGRECLFFALSLLGISHNDVVLLPDFICDVVLLPLNALKIKIVFYPITHSLSPNWDALCKLIEYYRPKAIVYVNYFGFYKDIFQYRSLAKRYGLIVIEDNAHGSDSMFISSNSSAILPTPLGRIGDIGLTSYWKTMPVPVGAGLFLNDREIRLKYKRYMEDKINTKKGIIYSYNHYIYNNYNNCNNCNKFSKISGYNLFSGDNINLLKFIIRTVCHWLNISIPYYRKRAYETLLEEIVNEAPSTAAYEKRLSFPHALLSAILKIEANNSEVNRERRRSIYNVWHNFCVNKGLRPIFPSLPNGVSPMVYPAYARDFAERQRWLIWGQRHGFDIYPWPSLPKEAVKAEAGMAVSMWKKILCFPIHQYMEPLKLKDRLKSLKKTI